MLASSEEILNERNPEISAKEIVEFAKEFHKRILLLGLVGFILGGVYVGIFGDYTATVSLANYAGIDIPRIKYLQTALPKLEQEYQRTKANEENQFLASDRFWERSIKSTILLTKADGKELLDTSALNAAASKVSLIQLSVRAKTGDLAERKLQKVSQFFIDGSSYIELRDLVRTYELKVISIDSTLKKKISSAEVELEYLQKRIKSLNELKGQYPNNVANFGQVLDAKDSGAKYLPITTQIVAATTDANNLRESLARYKDEENQNTIYKAFVSRAKPLLDRSEEDANLVDNLIAVASEMEGDINSAVQLIAIEEIKVALSAIQTNKRYGLRQIGVADIENPPYIKFIMIGLFSGLFIGFIYSLGLKIVNQPRSTLNDDI